MIKMMKNSITAKNIRQLLKDNELLARPSFLNRTVAFELIDKKDEMIGEIDGPYFTSQTQYGEKINLPIKLGDKSYIFSAKMELLKVLKTLEKNGEYDRLNCTLMKDTEDDLVYLTFLDSANKPLFVQSFSLQKNFLCKLTILVQE